MVPVPTVRLLALAIGAAVPLGLATLLPELLYVAVLYVAALGAMVVLDTRLGPAARYFTVERRHDQRLSLGEPNPIRIHVRWTGPRHPRMPESFSLWARDEHPVEIEADTRVIQGEISPGGEWVGEYHLHPVRRGDYLFGSAYLRVRMPLGLVIRQYRYPISGPVRVYPNLRAIRKYDLLARRGRLHEAGVRMSRMRGAGTEFERLRDYLPDDDYRRIAWKATARRSRPVTVEYETERSQNLILALDAGRLMGAPIGPMEKLDYAVNAALLLAYVASKVGDRVGLLAFADRVELYVPPRAGTHQFLFLLESLYKIRSQPSQPDVGKALSYLASRQARRSLIVLFTDLEESTEAERLAAHLDVLARRHLPLCVFLSDPDLPRVAEMAPSSLGGAYERVVAQRLLDERRRTTERLERLGAMALDVPAERLTLDVVNRYLEVKARARL